jgi:uncharacterized coiled-coil protein SlyX
MNEDKRLISAKNTAAVEETLKVTNRMVLEQQAQITHLSAMVGSLQQQLQSLQQLVNVLRAKFAGSGPTG